MPKVNNKNSGKRCEISSGLKKDTRTTLIAFIVNLLNSHLFLVSIADFEQVNIYGGSTESLLFTSLFHMTFLKKIAIILSRHDLRKYL